MSETRIQPEAATPTAAILLVFAAGVMFSCLDSTAKYLVLNGFDAPFVVWMRFATHVVLVLLLLRGWSDWTMYKAVSMPQQLLRGVFLFGSTFFNFLALQTLQLAEALSINFFAPMVVTALAGPLLGEWAGWRRWLAVIIGFVGILVVTRPGFASFGVGHLYAAASTLCYAFYVIMTRSMGRTESSSSMIFYSALAPVVFMSPAVPLYGSLPAGAFHWVLLLSLGAYGAFGHWLLIKAYKMAPASALAPYPYLQMVWTTTLGYLVFAEVPDRWTILGAAIIVASGLYIVNRERQLRLASGSQPNAEARDLAKKL